MVTDERQRQQSGALALTGIGLAVTLAATCEVFNAPQELETLAAPVGMVALIGLALAPALRLHGWVAIGVGLVAGYMGFVSMGFAAIHGMIRYETARWVDVTIGVLMLVYLAVILALVGAGVAGLVRRNSTDRSGTFGWWYVALAAFAIALQQMAWIVKFTLWEGPPLT